MSTAAFNPNRQPRKNFPRDSEESELQSALRVARHMRIMTTSLRTLKISGTAGVIAVSSTVLGASDAIGPDTHISMSVAIAITSVLVGAAFAIARTVTRWEDRLNSFQERLDSLRCMECYMDDSTTTTTEHFRKPRA